MRRLIDQMEAVEEIRQYITEPNISDDESEIKGFNDGLELAISVLSGMQIVEAVPKWIPVTERLPKRKPEDLEYPVVAVCLDDGSVITACYYESTETWGCGEYYDRFCYPVAWMPLPRPYKEEE